MYLYDHKPKCRGPIMYPLYRTYIHALVKVSSPCTERYIARLILTPSTDRVVFFIYFFNLNPCLENKTCKLKLRWYPVPNVYKREETAGYWLALHRVPWICQQGSVTAYSYCGIVQVLWIFIRIRGVASVRFDGRWYKINNRAMMVVQETQMRRKNEIRTYRSCDFYNFVYTRGEIERITLLF